MSAPAGMTTANGWPYRILVDAAAPICGDGIEEGAEACDDGNRNVGETAALSRAHAFSTDNNYACNDSTQAQ